MELLEKFSEKLKEKIFQIRDDLVVSGDNPWANGNTESGFYADQVIDMERLDAEINKLVEEFRKTKKE